MRDCPNCGWNKTAGVPGGSYVESSNCPRAKVGSKCWVPIGCLEIVDEQKGRKFLKLSDV